MLDLESLNCFVEAAKRLNFRAAARQVHLSPAAFSDRIQKLEQELGAPLFIRSTRRVRLSPQGEQLLVQAQKTLLEAQKCQEAVLKNLSVNLTIGTRYELGLSMVVPMLYERSKTHPSWKIHVVFGDSRSLLNDLRKGEIDAVIGSMRLTMTGLDSMPLHQERYCFVGSPNLLKRQELNGRLDALSHVLVDINPSKPLFGYWSDQIDSAKPWRFESERYMGTIAAIKYWVLHGKGIGVLPKYFIREELENGELIEIMPHIEARTDWFRLFWLSGHPREEQLTALGREFRASPLR